MWTKVTEEFKKEEQMRKKRKATQERNRKSAIAIQDRGAEEIQMDDDESGCEDQKQPNFQTTESIETEILLQC